MAGVEHARARGAEQRVRHLAHDRSRSGWRGSPCARHRRRTRRDGSAHRARHRVAQAVITRLPPRCAGASAPGSTTTVVNGDSMIAGPVDRASPAPSPRTAGPRASTQPRVGEIDPARCRRVRPRRVARPGGPCRARAAGSAPRARQVTSSISDCGSLIAKICSWVAWKLVDQRAQVVLAARSGRPRSGTSISQIWCG